MENNLNEDQIKEIRRQRLQQMGYPLPMEKPNFMPQVINVKDPNMLSRIQQIRQGQFKGEFSSFRKQTGEVPSSHQPVQPKQAERPRQVDVNGKPRVEAPKLQEFAAKRDPLLDAIEKDFGGSTSVPAPSQTGGRIQLSSPADFQEPIDAGKGFVDNLRNKFHSNMQQKQMAQQHVAQEQNYMQYASPSLQPQTQNLPPLQSGMIIMNEEDLKKKIINISKQVAKQVAEQVIKSVLLEYTKMEKKTTIVEDKNKKIEVLPDGMVKIDGKLYKLAPVAKKTVE